MDRSLAALASAISALIATRLEICSRPTVSDGLISINHCTDRIGFTIGFGQELTPPFARNPKAGGEGVFGYGQVREVFGGDSGLPTMRDPPDTTQPRNTASERRSWAGFVQRLEISGYISVITQKGGFCKGLIDASRGLHLPKRCRTALTALHDQGRLQLRGVRVPITSAIELT